jgi:hypothetical protein
MFEVPWSPGTKQLRQFAWACAPGFALIGLATHRWGASFTVAAIIAALGIVLCLVGLARPTALRVPYLLLMVVAAPIGWIVVRAGLLVFFFVVLVPLAVVFRLAGRDALGMGSKTGWHPAPPKREPSQYYRMG